MIELCMRYFCMALEASVVILLVLAARPFFKKFSNRITCLLWAVVMLRLLCPVTISNPFTDKTGENTKQEEAAFFSEKNTTMGYMAEAAYVNTKLISDSSNYSMKESEYAKNESGYSVTDSEFSMNASELSVNDSTFPAKDSEHSVNEGLSEKTKDEQGETKSWFGELAGQVSEKISQTMAKGRAWKQTDFGMIITNILGITWLLGMIGFLALGVIKYSKIVKKLGEAVPFGKWGKYKVKQSDIAGVPMSFGIIHPRIYVPLSFSDEKEDELTVAQQKMILIHESMHLKHFDPLWKLIAYIALSVHWWNPLVWLSLRCMNQDLEMACDENVIKQLGKENKQEYASTLLQFATNRSGISLTAAFGESHADRRIKNVLRYKAIPLWLTVTLGGLVLSLGGCLATVGGNLYSGEQTGSDNDALSKQSTELLEINATHFPDTKFREYISNHFDLDHDGFFSEKEMKSVTVMICCNMDIESLNGVEYFTELTKLDCSNNLLNNLDISKNTKLNYLCCSKNSINELDIQNCPCLIHAYDEPFCHDDGEKITFDSEKGYFEYSVNTNINIDVENLNLSFLFETVQKENWKEIYAKILEDWTGEAWPECGLIYLNEDDIPELVVEYCDSFKVFTIVNGSVYEMSPDRYSFCYWEGKNILDNTAGSMECYNDYLWTIGNDGFEMIHDCANWAIYNPKDDNSDDYEENWYYSIDKKDVTKEEYNDLVEGIIPLKEREYFEGRLSADRNNMLQYLKGETYKDYKEAYDQYIKNTEYKGFALIEREETAPLLLCVNEERCRIVAYHDGLISDWFELYMPDEEQAYVYAKSGMIETCKTEPLFGQFWGTRYQMKNGATTSQSYVEYESVDGDENNAVKEKHFEINGGEVTEEEYTEFLDSTKGYEKYRILPFGDPNAEIEYLSAEEMIEILK